MNRLFEEREKILKSTGLFDNKLKMREIIFMNKITDFYEELGRKQMGYRSWKAEKVLHSSLLQKLKEKNRFDIQLYEYLRDRFEKCVRF